MNLWQKISAVMAEVEYLKKDDVVGFGSNAYKAISEEKVTETVRKSFIKHGLVLMPVEQHHHCETRDTVNSKGDKAVSRLATVDVKYKLVDIETGEHEFIVSSGTGVDTQDKAVGKAMTYAYKYALLRTLMIPTGEDPDKIASDPPAEPQKKQEKKPNQNKPTGDFTNLTEAQCDELAKLATEARVSLGSVSAKYGVQGLTNLTLAQFEDAKIQLKLRIDKAKANSQEKGE